MNARWHMSSRADRGDTERGLYAVTLAGLALLLLATACAAPPARRASTQAAKGLLAQLEETAHADDLAFVGGLHRIGENSRGVNDLHDDALARTLEHELTFALHGGLRLIDQRAMDVALDVLRLQESDLYADGPEGAASIRRMGQFLKADLFVTGEYVLDESGRLELDLKALDMTTLELIATSRADSQGAVEEVADGTLYAGAMITSPLAVIWDIMTDVSETCFTEEDPHLGQLLVNWIKVPFYLPISPFLTDYETTRWWLRQDGESAGYPTGPAPSARRLAAAQPVPARD